MGTYTLAIGNRNYSSWSMRPWLLLRHFALPFEEIYIPLYESASVEQLARWSPSGMVPVLHDGDVVVWDSLAICEYLAECHPQLSMWPEDVKARAMARSISAEMHAGFGELRRNMPMNCRKRFPGKGLTPEVLKDIERIVAIWTECRSHFGASGAFLFGNFSIADAMYAPIVLRFATYEVPLDGAARDYSNAVLALPEVNAWLEAAQNEVETLPRFEIYG